MKYLRATIRLIGLCGITVGSSIFWLAGLTVLFAFPNALCRWRRQTIGGWARASARVLGMRISVRNPPPRAPFLLVSNHLSYLDIVVLESQVDCAFIAKSEIANWPLFGFMCRSLGMLFIDRKQKRGLPTVIARIAETLARGLGVVLFAEGTSTDGHKVSPFKSSLLEFAASNHLPVHYASISYVAPVDAPPASQSICWWGDMTFPDHVFRLLQLPGFEASVVFGAQPIMADNRRVLAAELWSAVSAQFTPVAAQR
jgi:1-acyl-sn-glycerol-3-phosphate acyltransferase